MIDEKYKEQVDLLLQILPEIANVKTFALKGGTAINMFERELPRLSVDIDLCYTELTARTEALSAIQTGLQDIKAAIQKRMPHVKIDATSHSASAHECKLFCRTHKTEVKIEVNTIMRGHVFPLRVMPLSQTVQNDLGHFFEMIIVSREELFGGKICAALDRQHPRDLFDVRILLSEEGLSRQIILGFIASLCSHNRPLHELLEPKFSATQEAFSTQFAGMTKQAFTYADFLETCQQLIQTIKKELLPSDKEFLISIKKANPDWGLIDIPYLQNMPAVLWKLENLRALIKKNPQKHVEQLRLLQETLGVYV
jgi:predicted nucleotidyltransferase component of viral defense system